MSSEAPAAWAHGLDPLLREGHRRLGSGHPVKQIRLGSLDHHEQEAIADLLGGDARPAPGQKVPWARVEEFVERVTGRPTRVVLEELYGPIGNRLAEQAAKADARATLWAWLREHDVVRKQELHGWAAEVEARGLRGTVDGTRSLLEQTLAVLDALPSTGEPLPVFAGRVLNDTHALDGGTGVAGLVLAALAGRQGVPRPSRAAERRGVWQTVGIADDALSSTVLVAGLDAVGSAPADDLCRLGFRGGRAVCLTLSDVRDGVPTVRAVGDVWVVENPAVLALALDEFGAGVPAMVCCSGWPSTAAIQLLDGLRGAGHPLWYHGDLDGEGVRIAAHVIATTGARAWRMSATDYLANVAERGAGVGRVTPAPWDDALAPAMLERGIAVLEETVWPDLRHDLRTAPATPR